MNESQNQLDCIITFFKEKQEAVRFYEEHGMGTIDNPVDVILCEIKNYKEHH